MPPVDRRAPRQRRDRDGREPLRGPGARLGEDLGQMMRVVPAMEGGPIAAEADEGEEQVAVDPGKLPGRAGAWVYRARGCAP
jgi:hypothetical protein